MIISIVGANWGDEGKGKITDMLAQNADYVVRFQGGANAGHTIINEYGRFALHLLPSGVFNKNVTNVIANGVALNIETLVGEIESVVKKGVPEPKIKISDRCQIVMPYHISFDKYEEERLGKNSYGSTKTGIAQFYADKYRKTGIQTGELLSDDMIEEAVDRVLEEKNVILEHLYHKEKIKRSDLIEKLKEYKEIVRPYLCDSAKLLREAVKNDRTVLLEGQLGTLKDTDHGIYPMVTSSSTLAGYASVGAGIAPYNIKKIIAVVKAYSSAVGSGDFVSEIFGDEADALRMHGGDKGEFGATTGRPRRMGWFDAVATRYGVETQGASDIAFMVVDALSYLDEIPVCVAYDIDGEISDEFPISAKLRKAKPVYKVLKGWKKDIRGIKNYEELPDEAKQYIEFIEDKLGKKFSYISTGPGRDEIIVR